MIYFKNMENNALQADYTNWVKGKDYPDFMDEISLATISKGYLLPGETVRSAYRRVARAAASRLKKPEFRLTLIGKLTLIDMQKRTRGRSKI